MNIVNSLDAKLLSNMDVWWIITGCFQAEGPRGGFSRPVVGVGIALGTGPHVFQRCSMFFHAFLNVFSLVFVFDAWCILMCALVSSIRSQRRAATEEAGESLLGGRWVFCQRNYCPKVMETINPINYFILL